MLVHLPQRVSVFHFSLNHKKNIFRIVFSLFVTLSFFHDESYNLFQVNVNITVFIGSIPNSFAKASAFSSV